MKTKLNGKKVLMLTAMVLMVILLLTAGSLAVFAEQASDVVSPEAQGNQILLDEPSKQSEELKVEDAELKAQSATRYVEIPAEFDYGAVPTMHAAINSERAKNGREPLRVDRKAVDFAMERAVESQLFYKDHYSPIGYVKVSRNDNIFDTENMSFKEGGTIEDLQHNFVQSSLHYANMLDPNHHSMGAGYVKIGNLATAIQIFEHETKGSDDSLPTGKVFKIVPVYFDPAYCMIQTFFTKTNGVELQSVDLRKGESRTIQLRASSQLVGSNEKVSWASTPTQATFSSSNPSVATVDANGKISAVSNGNATITATTGTERKTIEIKVGDDLQNLEHYVNIPAEFDYDAARKILSALNKERANAGRDSLHINQQAVDYAMERAVESQLLLDKTSPIGYVRLTRDTIFNDEIVVFGRYNNSTLESLMDLLFHSSNKTIQINPDYHTMGAGYVKIGNVGTASQIFGCFTQNNDDSLPTGKVSKIVPVYFEPSYCKIRTLFTNENGVELQSVGLKKGGSQTIQLRAYATLGNSENNVSGGNIPTTATFKSSNQSVATVDADGKVVAVSNGKATITATSGTESNTLEVTVADNAESTQYLDRMMYVLKYPGLNVTKQQFNLNAGASRSFSFEGDETHQASKITVKWTGRQTEITLAENCKYTTTEIYYDAFTPYQNIFVYPDEKQAEPTPSSNESITYTFVCEQTGISQNVVCQDGKTATYAFEGNDDYGPFSCSMKWENKSSTFAKITDCLVSTDGVKSVNGSYVQTIKLTPGTVKLKPADFRVRVAYPNAVNENYTLQAGVNRRIAKDETEDYEALSFNLSWDGTNYSVTNKNQCSVNVIGDNTKGFDVIVTPVAKSKDNAVTYTVSYDSLNQKDTRTCAVGESVDFSVSNHDDFEDLHFTLTWDGKTTTVSDRHNCEVTIGDFSNGNQSISVKPTATKDKSLTYHVIYEQLGMTKTAVCDVNQQLEFKTDATEKYVASDFRLFWDGENTHNFYRNNCLVFWGKIYTVNGKKQQDVTVTLRERDDQPDTPDPAAAEQKVAYRTHVQDVGWQPYVTNGTMAGTSGKSLRLEGMNIKLVNNKYDGNIEYRTHIQNIGWEENWKQNDVMSGTSGKSLRLEAMQVRLTGEMAKHYDICYRVHAENFGWLNWAKNGQPAGTEGYGYRLEGMQLMLVEKGKSVPNITPLSVQSDFYKKNNDPGFYIPNNNLDQVVEYTTHVQNVGWQPYMTNGMMAGTSGKALRLEGLRINLTNPKYSGSVLYRTHIENIGWESTYRSGGAMSGTSGRSLRLEAMQISLTGEMAKHYDIYYRVHAQNFGWLGWAKNGESAGTAGYGYRLEGLQIVLVEKGQDIYQLNPDRPKTDAFKSKDLDDLSLKTQ